MLRKAIYKENTTADLRKWELPGEAPIRTDCDTKHIAGINITVLNGHKDPTDQHNVALVRGKLAISNFIVGDTSSKAYSVPNPVIALSDTVKTITDTTDSLGVININSFTNIWSAKTDVTWLTATIDTLSGKGTLTVKASGNSSAKTRKAVVTLVSKFNITKTIVII